MAPKLPAVNQAASSELDLKVKTPKSPAGGKISAVDSQPLRCNRCSSTKTQLQLVPKKFAMKTNAAENLHANQSYEGEFGGVVSDLIPCNLHQIAINLYIYQTTNLTIAIKHISRSIGNVILAPSNLLSGASRS